MRPRSAILTALILVLGYSAAASPPLAVKDYTAGRGKLGAVSLKTAAADPSAHIGKTVEIRGTLSGLAGGESGKHMIVRTPEGDSYLIAAEAIPASFVGTELACLVRVGEGSTHGLTNLTLICCAYDVELRREEEAWRKAQAAKAAAAKPKPAASRASNSKQAKAQTITADQLIRAYRNAVKSFNRKLSDSEADTIARSILGFSFRYGVDARLVCAVILAESHFRPSATSWCGAMGLGQLMPTTAAGLGVNDGYDPVQNIYGSVRYIRSMLDRMSGQKSWNELTWGDLSLALAAYNAGPGAVRKHGGIPPYKETRNYVKRVTSIYKQLCGVRG